MLTHRVILDTYPEYSGPHAKVHGTDQDLLFPPTILEQIQMCKDQAFSEVYDRHEGLITEYTSPKSSLRPGLLTICDNHNKNCDALVLGSLMQSLSNDFTSWPNPGPPYRGISIDQLAQEIMALKISSCSNQPNDYHGIKPKIMGSLQTSSDWGRLLFLKIDNLYPNHDRPRVIGSCYRIVKTFVVLTLMYIAASLPNSHSHQQRLLVPASGGDPDFICRLTPVVRQPSSFDTNSYSQ
ncbi:hypothetical protein VTL71DRAFT_12929 [Oculimacula yallundae]|uniref:Uncharacterized protein n=1 Tax=Oculimacula yallundae TaxID=86028 RepID=A0ABR4CP32_9HELO